MVKSSDIALYSGKYEGGFIKIEEGTLWRHYFFFEKKSHNPKQLNEGNLQSRPVLCAKHLHFQKWGPFGLFETPFLLQSMKKIEGAPFAFWRQ